MMNTKVIGVMNGLLLLAMIRNIIVFTRSDAERIRLNKFVEENENDYKFIRGYNRSGNWLNLDSIGRIYSCISEKAQFKIRLMFECKDYVV